MAVIIGQFGFYGAYLVLLMRFGMGLEWYVFTSAANALLKDGWNPS